MADGNAATALEGDSVRNAADEYAESLEAKILFGLSVYPYLSPSMLHVFLGTATPASLWKDTILARLLTEGQVVQEEIPLQSPAGRSQTYTILRLPNNVYKPPRVQEQTAEPREQVQEAPYDGV
jgi:hypothetical protein